MTKLSTTKLKKRIFRISIKENPPTLILTHRTTTHTQTHTHIHTHTYIDTHTHTGTFYNFQWSM